MGVLIMRALLFEVHIGPVIFGSSHRNPTPSEPRELRAAPSPGPWPQLSICAPVEGRQSAALRWQTHGLLHKECQMLGPGCDER